MTPHPGPVGSVWVPWARLAFEAKEAEMAQVQTAHPALQARASSAAVWINAEHALVATTTGSDRVFTCEINRGRSTESSFMAVVVRAVGDHDRVVILGPSSTRLALEREYVAFFQRPDRIMDVEASDEVGTPDLIERLHKLVA